MEQTLGRQRVSFSNKEPEHIRSIKLRIAAIIDELQLHRGIKASHRTAPENTEKQRVISLAQTKLEEACMFVEKALNIK